VHRSRWVDPGSRLLIADRVGSLQGPDLYEIRVLWWALFCNATVGWLDAIIGSFKGDLSVLGSVQEVRSQLLLHLHNKVLPAYRPGRGKLYSLVTFAARTYILSLLEKQRRFCQRYLPLAEVAYWTGAEALGCESELDALGLEFATEPEVYSELSELRERSDYFTSARDELFLVRNVIVMALMREGKGVPLVPTLAQLSSFVAQIVSLPQERALEQTAAALDLLREELSDFRGSAPSYASKPATESATDRLQQDSAEPDFAMIGAKENGC
jgi:hypothetical protein